MTERAVVRHRLTIDEPVKAVDADYAEVAALLARGGEKGAPIEGAFVPDDDDVALLSVTGFFRLPEELARVMAVPGVPHGHVVMAYGKKDSGKTTFAIECLIAAQRDGGVAILLDTEHKFNLKRAADMGLDVKRLVIIQADVIEEAFWKFKQVIDALRRSPRFETRPFLCVWDSLGQTPTAAEEKVDASEFAMAAAKVIKGGMRRLVKWLRESNTAFVIINQVYSNMNQFGKKTTPYGGSGPEYASVVMLEFASLGHMRPKGVKADEGDMAGTKVQVECTKNHLGQPFRKLTTAVDWRGFAFGRDVEYAPDPKAVAGGVT